MELLAQSQEMEETRGCRSLKLAWLLPQELHICLGPGVWAVGCTQRMVPIALHGLPEHRKNVAATSPTSATC